jgi:hypothetical protein
MNCTREWAALQRTRTMLAILPFGSSPLACRSAATAESRDGPNTAILGETRIVVLVASA